MNYTPRWLLCHCGGRGKWRWHCDLLSQFSRARGKRCCPPCKSSLFILVLHHLRLPSCTDCEISQASSILQQNPAPKHNTLFAPTYLKFCFVQASAAGFPVKPGCAVLGASCPVSCWESGRYGRGCICFISGVA